MILRHTSIIVLALVISACAGQATVTPQFATLSSGYDNITIRAKDKSWELRANKTIVPPRVDKLVSHPAIYSDRIDTSAKSYNNPRLKDYVMDVDVQVGKKETFHGKVVFFDVYEGSAEASPKRMWSMGVPNQYIDTARQGNVAVVYQPYTLRGVRREYVSWILWFSKLPL